MKVGILYLHPVEESPGSFVRVRELSEGLVRRGVEVVVVTPYGGWFGRGVRVKEIGEFLRGRLGDFCYGVSRRVYYSRYLPALLFNERVQRVLMRGIIKGLRRVCLEEDFDVLQVEQDFGLLPGVVVSGELGLPVVADIHNITAEELVALGLIDRRSAVYGRIQSFVGNLIRRMDHVVVVSELMGEYVRRVYGVSGGRVTVVPPGGRLRVSGVGREYKPPYRVIFAGSVTYRERVDLFVESLRYVAREVGGGFCAYITNKGDMLLQIRRLARRLGVPVRFFWIEGASRFYRFLSGCHVGVLPSSDDLARRMGTPVKLFDYMSVGLPVVANDVGGWSRIIREEGVGVLTGESPEEFAEGILRLLLDGEFAVGCGRRGLEVVSGKYSWDASAGILMRVYERLTGG